MNETKLAQPTTTDIRNEREAANEPQLGEIRLLCDLELMLAGGGDQIHGWP